MVVKVALWYELWTSLMDLCWIIFLFTHDVGHVVGEARLAFDTIASSHFHVIEYVDVNAVCIGVQIYSSQTAAWIYKESKWGGHTNVTFLQTTKYVS